MEPTSLSKIIKISFIRHSSKGKGFISFLFGFLNRIIFFPFYYHTRQIIRSHRAKSLCREIAFDLIYGTDTYDCVELNHLPFVIESKNHGVDYRPTPINIFLPVISQLPIEYENYSFIDIGSGKGRNLLLASRLPFKNIQGIEFSPELNQIANKNISNFLERASVSSEISSHCIDAQNYIFPNNPFVVFMYNPFDENIMSQVLKNLGYTLRKNSQPFFVIYHNSKHEDILESSDFLSKIKDGHIETGLEYATKAGIIMRVNYPCSIYTSKAIDIHSN